MSTLKVEVCSIAEITAHNNADSLELVLVKGWQVCVKKGTFKKGQKVIYFPPDSILPEPLANSPFKMCPEEQCRFHKKETEQNVCDCGTSTVWKDGTPGRLGVKQYLGSLRQDQIGAGKVKACRLRGKESFGVIMPLEAKYGDDINWKVGKDLTSHFKIVKWEPLVENTQGEAEKPNSQFHTYTSIEHLANNPDIILENEEVVITEKSHGTNSRVGIVNVNGVWTIMAGSHNVQRREYPIIKTSFIENLKTFFKTWKWPKKQKPQRSLYWSPITPKMIALLNYIKDLKWEEPINRVIVFGEIIGTQDMKYGLDGTDFLGFDVAINGRYVDFETKKHFFEIAGIKMVPILYEGLFNKEVVKDLTSGPTTMCDPKKAGGFKGREGVVVTLRKENRFMENGKRIIFKSISADYLDRKNGTENH